MKFICIRKIVFFREESGLSSAHYALFHGLASRTGNFLTSNPADVLDEKTKKLHLVLNAAGLRAVIQPSTNLLFHDEARQALGSPRGTIWQDTVVERICEIDYKVGEPVVLEESPGFMSTLPERTMLKRSRLAATQTEDVPKFSEFLVPALEPLVEKAKETRTLKLEFPANGEESELIVSPQVLSEFPITWWYDGYHVINERAYSSISKYFDRNYFEIIKAEL